MTEYLQTFLIGGSIISFGKYVSTVFPPAYSGLVGAFPVSLITSFFLLNDKVREKFFQGAILSDILVTTAITSILIIRYYNKSIPVNYITIFALILWIILGIAIIKFGYKQ
tara:strand:+ start:4536 stop:4868 length:333 start_codon:yes stop_codon:yes gene_type:complete